MPAPREAVVVVERAREPRNADEAEGSARRSGKGSKGSRGAAGPVGAEARGPRGYAGYLRGLAAGWPFSSVVVPRLERS